LVPPPSRKHRPTRQNPRRRRPPACLLEGDRLVFGKKVDTFAAKDAFRAASRARNEGTNGLTLDFGATERAYPEGVVQIVALTDRLRAEDMHFDVILPHDKSLSGVFAANNWAHFMSPLLHGSTSDGGDLHLPLRRYRTGEEQQKIVDDSLELLLHQMKVERPVLHALEWSLNEITDNVLNHADAPGGGLVQVVTFKTQRRIQFVVADGGRGILASMRETQSKLRKDTDAIGEAMKQGVTRDIEKGQGNGLAGALRIATGSNGSMAIISGRGEVRVMKGARATEHKHHAYLRRQTEDFMGTLVFVELRVDQLVNLEEALDFGGGGPDWDYIDARYGEEAEDVRLQVADESVGFGSRVAGKALRTKINNLLRAKPKSSIVLDWTGIPLVSSSFADEALGRLFVELGPLSFAARVRSTGMEKLVRQITDQTILQRAAQAASPRSPRPPN
jgi:anti-sigma regulatory factor (Ser/Thr protein kinase)